MMDKTIYKTYHPRNTFQTFSNAHTIVTIFTISNLKNHIKSLCDLLRFEIVKIKIVTIHKLNKKPQNIHKLPPFFSQTTSTCRLPAVPLAVRVPRQQHPTKGAVAEEVVHLGRRRGWEGYGFSDGHWNARKKQGLNMRWQGFKMSWHVFSLWFNMIIAVYNHDLR